jgi:two-component system sensor histidine kinase YesM
MRTTANLFFRSLQFKLIFGFLAVTLPLCLLLIYNNRYAVQVVRNQVAQSNKNLVSMYMKLIDRNLEEADSYLFDMASRETDLLGISSLKRNYDADYELTKLRLMNKISADVTNYQMIDMFFIYSVHNDDLLISKPMGDDYFDEQNLRDHLVQLMKAQVDNRSYAYDKWYDTVFGDGHYLYHFVRTADVFVGWWVNVKQLMVPLTFIDLGDQGKAFFVAENGVPMGEANFINEHHINLASPGANSRYLLVGEKSGKGDFSLVAAIPNEHILENLPFMQRIESFILLGSVLLIPIILLFLRRVVLVPMSRIVAAMRKIKAGQWETRITGAPASYEFELMNDTFNGMVAQIQELKIDIYEEKLHSQRAELQHLQLQINPHFFLNSLNIVYYLAKAKDFGLIMEMSQCLIQYFRFMFRSSLTFVELEEEVQHTHNYLRIQQLRFPESLTYAISSPESSKQCLVPPLVIQTFVENTIKHAVDLDHPMHLDIRIEPDEAADNEGGLKISILDTGKGFSGEVLEQLRAGEVLTSEQGEHIGIWNVQRRLSLLYNGKARLSFANAPGAGAFVAIHVPIVQETT